MKFAFSQAGSSTQHSATVTAKATDIPVCAGSWDANTVYRKPDRVTYQGKVYEAKWWTLNERPGSSQVWLFVGDDPSCK